MSLPPLLALATVTRYRTQDIYRQRQFAQYGATILACLGIFLPAAYAWVVATLAFGIQAFAVVLRLQARQLHELSRDAQRRALLEDTLGCRIESFDVAELYNKVGRSLAEAASKYAVPDRYYNNDYPHGVDRLREALQESTFWSRSLLLKAAERVRNKLIITTIVVLAPAFAIFVIGTPFNYTIAVALLTILVVLVDDIESFVSCTSASKQLYDLDRRLEKVDTKAYETLLAAFADYSVATAAAPPIPSGIYAKAKNHLTELWLGRQAEATPLNILQVAESREQILPVGGLGVDIELEEKDLPVWLGVGFVRRVVQATCNIVCPEGTGSVRAVLESLPGFSGTPVFSLDVRSGRRLILRLVLRFQRSVEDARREVEVVRRLSATGIDAVCYTALGEPLVSAGVVVYYHAQHQAQEDIITLDDFLTNVVASNTRVDALPTNHRLYTGLASVATAYEMLATEYVSRPIAEIAPEHSKQWLSDFVIDIRAESAVVDGTFLCARYLNGYPDFTAAIPQLDHPSEVSTGVNPWVSVKGVIDGVYDYGARGANVILKGAEWTISVLIAKGVFDKITSQLHNITGLVLNARAGLEPSWSQLERECGLVIPNRDMVEATRKVLTNDADFGCTSAFRHRDLHCLNILVSANALKVVDVGDSGQDLVFADLARLEISVLSCFGRQLSLTEGEMLDVISKCEADRSKWEDQAVLPEHLANMARLVNRLRACFEKKFKLHVSEMERHYAYFNELQRQLSHSLISTQRLSGACAALVAFWTDELGALLRK